MYRTIAACLVASAWAFSLQAQVGLPNRADPALTLAQALTLAGTASPTRDVTEAGIRIARAQHRLASQRPNPSIVAETENVGGSGMYRGLRSAETTVGLALPLELGGKRGARMAVAEAQIGRAGILAEIARADLRLRVSIAYTAAAATQRRAAMTQQQMGVAAEGLRVAHARVQAGRASPLEEQRAQVAHLTATGAAERAERSADLARSNLARFVGIPVGTLDADWFERVDPLGPGGPTPATTTLADAAARADVDIAKAQIRLAQSQRLPDLTVSASARRLEQTHDVAAVFGVSIPLSVFNTGRASVSLANAHRDQLDAVRRVSSFDTEQEIAAARGEAANAASTALSASGPALTAAAEAARIARIGYREGKFGQLDLLDAERTLLDTRMAAVDALAAYHDAQARLERLTADVPIGKENNR